MLVSWPQLLLLMMYVLQSVPETAVRSVDASVALVASDRSEVEPTVPVLVPHAAGGPGACVTLVPGANPTTVMSNGLAAVVVPGTRKATPLMGSLLYLVPVVFQQVVLKELNGTKLGPFAPGILAHQRLVGSVAPLTP